MSIFLQLCWPRVMSEDEFHAIWQSLNDVFDANPTPAAMNLLVRDLRKNKIPINLGQS